MSALMLRKIHFVIALGAVPCVALPREEQSPATASQIASPGKVAAAPGAEANKQPEFRPRNPRYQLRPADVIEVSFYPAAEFNQTLTVQPDGFVALRDADDLYVEGKTIPELREAVTSAYQKILSDPIVTIVLKEFETPHFTVGGQVAKPGKYELRADTTAAEAVAIAGGINEKAKHSQVLLFRRVSDDWVEAKQLDLKAIYKGNFNEDIHLRPGDMLFVPQNKFSKMKPLIPIWSVGTYISPTTF